MQQTKDYSKDNCVPFPLIEWAKWGMAGGIPEDEQPWTWKKPKVLPHWPKKSSRKSAYDQAWEWLSNQPGAIQGQGGSNYTFKITMGLMWAFGLDERSVRDLIGRWNADCKPPWSDKELDQKVKSAIRRGCPTGTKVGWVVEKNRKRQEKEKARRIRQLGPKFAEEMHGQIVITPLNLPVVRIPEGPDIDNPAILAARFQESIQNKHGVFDCCIYNKSFYEWSGNCYVMVDREAMKSRIAHYVEWVFEEKYKQDMNMTCPEDRSKIKRHKVHGRLVEDIVMLLLRDMNITPDPPHEPFWISQPSVLEWDPQNMIPFNNKTIYIPNYVSSHGEYEIPITPRYFTTYALDYDFDFGPWEGPVEPPPEWKKFLLSIWKNDPESIACLQEIMGYLMSPATKYQKMFMFSGPPRSGKGTIIRVCEALVGKKNCCSPNFKSLSNDFGRQELVGKKLAILGDAQAMDKQIRGQVTETILTIVGEDSVTINPKNVKMYSTRLSCRFVMAFNETPAFEESSGALLARAIILRLTKSYEGCEDIELEQKLSAEISQIARWALDGLKRLYERGHFEQPKEGKEIARELRDTSSEIKQFLDDCCDVSPELEVPVGELFMCWRQWCSNQGIMIPGKQNLFSRRLRAAIPNLLTRKARDDSNREYRMFVGVHPDPVRMVMIRRSQTYLVTSGSSEYVETPETVFPNEMNYPN
jgi:P4 family phage/plasmid primase-like protien